MDFGVQQQGEKRVVNRIVILGTNYFDGKVLFWNPNQKYPQTKYITPT